MTSPRARLVAIATALGLAATLTACSTSVPSASTPTPTTDPVSGGSVVFALDVEPTCFDPQKNGAITNAVVIQNVVEPLVHQNEDGSFTPWLAESFEVSDDGLRYTFTLPEGVTFHDGTELTADAVKANFDRWSNPATQSGPGQSLGYVETIVEDPQTATIVLNRVNPLFLQSISMPQGGGIISPTALAEHADELCGGVALAGTGPFVFESYTKGSSATFARFEDYAAKPGVPFHQGPAYLDGFEIQFLPESAVRVGALTSGQAQIAAGIAATDLPTLEASSGVGTTAGQLTGISYSLLPNTSRAPFDDITVREALRSALDIDSALEGIYRGSVQRAWSPLAPNTPPADSYNEDLEDSWEFDVEEAEALLDEAGWTETDDEGFRVKDGQRLTARWIVNGSLIKEQRDVLGEALVAQAAEAGIEIVREVLDPGTFTERAKANDYELSDTSLQRAEADILTSVALSTKTPDKNSFNYSHISSPEIDELLTLGQTSDDPAARAEAYREVQQIIDEEASIIPVYVPVSTIGVSDDVHGVSFTLSGHIASLLDVWVQP